MCHSFSSASLGQTRHSRSCLDRPKELPLAALVGVLLIMQANSDGLSRMCFVLILYMWHLFLNVHLFFLVNPKYPDPSKVPILRTRTPAIQVPTPPLEGPRILREGNFCSGYCL